MCYGNCPLTTDTPDTLKDDCACPATTTSILSCSGLFWP